MEEQLISFKTAKLAKEKKCDLILFGNGFKYTDKDGNEYWTSKEKGISGEEKTTTIINCTQSLLQKWLREVHDIFLYVIIDDKRCISYVINQEYYYDIGPWNGNFNTYEEALEKGLYEALKLIE